MGAIFVPAISSLSLQSKNQLVNCACKWLIAPTGGWCRSRGSHIFLPIHFIVIHHRPTYAYTNELGYIERKEYNKIIVPEIEHGIIKAHAFPKKDHLTNAILLVSQL